MARDCACASRRGLPRVRLEAPPTALLCPPPLSGRSHEFSVTVGAEKALVIVTGYGCEESRASLGWEKWRFLAVFPTANTVVGLLSGPHDI